MLQPFQIMIHTMLHLGSKCICTQLMVCILMEHATAGIPGDTASTVKVNLVMDTDTRFALWIISVLKMILDDAISAVGEYHE